MEIKKIKQPKDSPSTDFYYVCYGDGSKNIVSAVEFKGGFLYYLIQSDKEVFDKNFDPKIVQISNIVALCGSPSTTVVAIDKEDEKNKALYEKLCECIENFTNESKQSVFE